MDGTSLRELHPTHALLPWIVTTPDAARKRWSGSSVPEPGQSSPEEGEMDATGKPHRIPPAMGLYAEKHKVFHLMQSLMEALLVHQPPEPIDFMIRHLKKDNDEVPRVFMVGPPASGKTTIARWLCKHLGAVYLCPQELMHHKELSGSKEAEARQARKEKVPDELWASLLEERVGHQDCERFGWVLDGFPETRQQALLLQSRGISPQHVVVLFAPDTVLVERNLGKLLDPLTQEVYHATFDWPTDFTVQKRLVVPEGVSERSTAKRLLHSHRHAPGLLQAYQQYYKAINADQPCADIFAQALTFVQSRRRSSGPFTPRVVLLGPPGSGKSLQAALLSQKYGLANVHFEELLRQLVAAKVPLGDRIRPCFSSGLPVSDSVALQALAARLSQQDCLAFGWVLHGFPRDVDQASLFQHMGYEPNRVFFLSVPTEVAVQRLCQRTTDPVTGERYHSVFKPPTEEAVHQRLLRNPKDVPQGVETQVDFYNRQVADLEEFYEDGISINADQDPYTIFEYIESCLVKPLPITKR